MVRDEEKCITYDNYTGGIFTSQNEKVKSALKEASEKLNNHIEEKGYFTKEDVNITLFGLRTMTFDYVLEAIKDAFDFVRKDIPFVRTDEADIILENVRNGKSFILYEIEQFGDLISIMWKYGDLTGRSELLKNPTFDALCEFGKDILSRIEKSRTV